MGRYGSLINIRPSGTKYSQEKAYRASWHVRTKSEREILWIVFLSAGGIKFIFWKEKSREFKMTHQVTANRWSLFSRMVSFAARFHFCDGRTYGHHAWK